MAKRKQLSKKIRFEVFKRDRFTCQYCGRQAPEVVLHIDHVVPVAHGGTDDVLNLVTSCVDCNLGKGPRELGDETALAKQKEQLNLIAERREQIALMVEWKKSLLDINKDEVNAVDEYICGLTDGHLTESGKKDIAGLLRKYGLSDVIDALAIAHAQYWGAGQDFERRAMFEKLPGILHNRKIEREDPHHAGAVHIANVARKSWRANHRGAWTSIYNAGHLYLEQGRPKSELMLAIGEAYNLETWMESLQ